MVVQPVERCIYAAETQMTVRSGKAQCLSAAAQSLMQLTGRIV